MNAFAYESVFTTGIVAFSVIAIVFAIVLLVNIVLKHKAKWEKPKECNACKKTNRLHMYYIASILLFLLIQAFTYIMVNGNHYAKVNEYFTFAATIVSIILAILTIVYSYYINASSTGQVEKLNKTSDEISEVSTNISEASKSIDVNATRLAENIDKILAQLDEVKQTTVSKLDDLNQKVDAIKAVPNENISESSKTKKTKKIQENEDNKEVEKFINNISLLSKCTLLAAKYSLIYDKTFIYSDVVSDTNGDYMWGFLAATSAIGFIGFDYNNGTIKVTWIHEYIQSNIEGILEKRLQQSSDENSKRFINDSKTKIKNHFGVTEEEEKTE